MKPAMGYIIYNYYLLVLTWSCTLSSPAIYLPVPNGNVIVNVRNVMRLGYKKRL